MRRLENKVAIVTGAGSGIGEATARLMAREGASVVVADINGTEAERVAGELASAVAAEVDVSNEPSVVRRRDRRHPEAVQFDMARVAPGTAATSPTAVGGQVLPARSSVHEVVRFHSEIEVPPE